MHRLQGRAHRRGVSLVELVAVMVAGSVLMGVTIAAVIAVQRADQRFNRRMSERRALVLLIDQLRLDVHAARRVTWEANASRLTMTTPADGRVIYELESRRWERRVSDQADGAPQLAGAFRAPSGFACRVSPLDAETGSLVRIEWVATAKSHDPRRSAAPTEDLVAAVGRDLTLLHESDE